MPFKVKNQETLKEMDEGGPEFDMKDRDPNQMNSYLQAQWNDVVAEPEGIRSANCIWKSSYQIFRCSRCFGYNLLSAIFFIPISFFLGLRLACVSFQHIWCFAPLLKDLRMNFVLLRTFCTLCCDTIVGPMFETIGLVFSRFKFTFFTQKSRPCCEGGDSRDSIHRI